MPRLNQVWGRAGSRRWTSWSSVTRFRRASSAQERQSVVQLFGNRVGREVERLLQLGDGFGVGRRILVESLAEIAMALERVVRRGGGAEGEQCDDRGRDEDPGVLRRHQGEL